MVRKSAARIVFQPELHRAFQRGIQQVVDAVRPTLGPMPRHVANARMMRSQLPELLDDGGTIARRIIDLPNRTENAGAMLVRHMLWQLHKSVGDGTATAAVIFERIYNEGVRYLASGGSAMRLRQHLEAAVPSIMDCLEAQSMPISGERMLTQVAESVCHDAELAAALAEIFDVIGPYGRLEIRPGRTRGFETEYIDGTYWKSGVFSERMIHDKLRNRRQLQNVAVFISDFELQDPHDLIPLMKAAVRPDVNSLVIVAKQMTNALNQLLIMNEKPDTFDIIAVRVPGTAVPEQSENLIDLAALTGGRVCFSAAGDSIRSVQWEDLGRSRRAWADQEYFGIVAGQGNPCARRERIAQAKARWAKADDATEKKRLQRRIGNLLGGSAVLKVSGVTKVDANVMQTLAERTAEALRSAMLDGVLPGGGMALLACRDALKRASAEDADERAAYLILQKALEAPACAIAMNAGYDAGVIMAQYQRSGVKTGFDVTRGEMVDMAQAGIYDSAAVVKTAVQTAIHTAALALTTDVLIQHRNPVESSAP